MTRKRCNYLLKRIRRKIRSGDVKFKLSDQVIVDNVRVDGTVDTLPGEIDLVIIDIKEPSENLAVIILHELLHSLYPDMSEGAILALEVTMFKALTVRQIQNLIKLVMEYT